jgi:hypothetical protein
MQKGMSNMAQRLDPNIVSTAHLATLIDTHQFRTGFVEGLSGEYTRFPVGQPITENDIVEIVRNLTEIAQERWLTEDMLRHDCGPIAGWISQQAFMEEQV